MPPGGGPKKQGRPRQGGKKRHEGKRRGENRGVHLNPCLIVPRLTKFGGAVVDNPGRKKRSRGGGIRRSSMNRKRRAFSELKERVFERGGCT